MIIASKMLVALVMGTLLTGCVSSVITGPPQRVRDEALVEVPRRPATFTETFRWSDGLSAQIVAIDNTTLTEPSSVDVPNARTGDQCSRVTVVVRNGSPYGATVRPNRAAALRTRSRPGRRLCRVGGARVAL